MGGVDPLRITVDEERQAVALAQELIGVSGIDRLFEFYPSRRAAEDEVRST